MVCALAVYCVVVFSKFKVLCCERSCCFFMLSIFTVTVTFKFTLWKRFILPESLIWQWRIRRGVWRGDGRW